MAFQAKAATGLDISRSGKNKKSSQHELFTIDSLLISSRKPGSNGLQQVFLKTEKFTGTKKNCKEISAKSIMPWDGKKLLSDLVKGKFKQINPSIRIWNFKVGFTGAHHHCSEKHLQGYVDEFMFKSNNRHRGNEIWYLLMKLLVYRTQKNELACKLNG